MEAHPTGPTCDSNTESVDVALARIADAYDWIQALRPTNSEEVWERFRAGDPKEPVFEYAPLRIEPDSLRRDLLAIPIETIGDPVLEELLREKQLEVERHLSMLRIRGTTGFLHVSLNLYGDADAELVALAERILSAPEDPEDPEDADDEQAEGVAGYASVGATELARRARAEMCAYRERFPDFPIAVVVRDDVTAGIMVSRGELRIARDIRVSERRVAALLAHEVGTHVLTFHNGMQQPIRQFGSGLAGYEALQEGLGVCAEALAGGLSRSRLRTLAGRVIAVRHCSQGASFVETYRKLETGCGLGRHDAFTTALRVFRGGGLTKDAVYLRGLRDLLSHLAEGHDIERLYLGKIALRHLPAIDDLSRRGVLRERGLALPRCLVTADGRARFEALRGSTVWSLFDGGVRR